MGKEHEGASLLAGADVALRRRSLRFAASIATVVLLAAAAGSCWLLAPAWRLFARIDTRVGEPSRLYARPLSLHRGDPIDLARIREELEALAYHEQQGAGIPAPGGFRLLPRGVLIHVRRFPSVNGMQTGGLLEIRFGNGGISRLVCDGKPAEVASLEPVLLGAYLDDDRSDRRPLPPGPLPEPLVHAVLAAEDDGFFSHPGVSLRGIVRAAWVDLRQESATQGGSTLTQQLVKNLALSGERTLTRKAKEAVLAVLVEARFSKREILRAYLDTVYLGAYDGVSLIGVGAAARAYFGKDPDQLTLAESATLAGMLPAPAHTSPIANSDRARSRRDRVLRRMVALGWLAAGDGERAMSTPVHATPEPSTAMWAPYAAEAVRAEARERTDVTRLEGAGLDLLSTLDWRDQRAAAEAVEYGLERLERRSGRRATGELQGALVSLDPRDGAVLAYVGGRDWSASQFDRAANARRQAGSAFKPIVYAAAFERGVAAPATILSDEPLLLPAGHEVWAPRNDDGTFLGPVAARIALEESRNVPAARLGLDTGLDAVVTMARTMGVTSPLEAVPALSLGAFAVSPRELAAVYATLAAGGACPSVHLLDAVLGPGGRPVGRAPLHRPGRKLSAAVAFLVTDVLRGVLDRGTGRSARYLGVDDALAAKTGTTNGGRDAWFAGYSPDRATVVWVGRDDDSPAALTGAGAALPLWARFTVAVRPSGGYLPFEEPGGVVRAFVDPESGELATSRCPQVVSELFLAGRAPGTSCHLHSGYLALPVAQPGGVPVERPGLIRRLLARLFGRTTSRT
jgi:penicillin-binding protein 1B